LVQQHVVDPGRDTEGADPDVPLQIDLTGGFVPVRIFGAARVLQNLLGLKVNLKRRSVSRKEIHVVYERKKVRRRGTVSVVEWSDRGIDRKRMRGG